MSVQLSGDSTFLSRLQEQTLLCPILIAAVKRNATSYVCRDGVYYYVNARGLELPFIPSSMYTELIAQYHMPVLSGHVGVAKVYAAMREAIYFPKMKENIQEFVAKCPYCQRNKSSNYKKYGLLKPILMQSKPWCDISIDFMTRLPLSNDCDSIMTVTDRFSKMIICIGCSSRMNADELV